jgi:hypothetical protein
MTKYWVSLVGGSIIIVALGVWTWHESSFYSEREAYVLKMADRVIQKALPAHTCGGWKSVAILPDGTPQYYEKECIKDGKPVKIATYEQTTAVLINNKILIGHTGFMIDKGDAGKKARECLEKLNDK